MNKEETAMYTLQQVKDTYYAELANLNITRMDLDTYIREYYISVYELGEESIELIGYNRKLEERCWL